MNDAYFLQRAIELSRDSVSRGGFPVGAVVTLGNKIIGEGVSGGKNKLDPTSHAETESLRNAAQHLRCRDVKGGVLYSSMEPCLMCFSACYWASIEKIVYAVPKEKLKSYHYDGLHDLHAINMNNNRKLEIVHLTELEDAAFNVIEQWESSRLSKHSSSCKSSPHN